MPTASILILEPDKDLCAQVSTALAAGGHDVHCAASGGGAVEQLRDHRADLLLADWTLPDFTGIEVLHQVKRDQRLGPVRVVMTSNRGNGQDVVTALQSGADDYLSKPYELDELIARISVCLRRPPVSLASAEVTEAGDIRLDDASHRVTVRETPIDLAPREYRLLKFFMHNPERLYSRKQLLTFVWDQRKGLGERTVDVHVRRLRRLLEPFDCAGYVQTVRGTGYRFSPPHNLS